MEILEKDTILCSASYVFVLFTHNAVDYQYKNMNNTLLYK